VSAKSIELLVLENENLVRMKLAEIMLSDQPRISSFNPRALEHWVWKGISERYEVKTLVQNYIHAILKTQRIFAKIVKDTTYQRKAELETITRHPFIYASPAAYQKVRPQIKKEKKGDDEIKSVAHLSWQEGIFVMLGHNYTYQTILGSNIHEHAHFMHYTLYPQFYNYYDSTMKECLAIFVEEKCNIKDIYEGRNPHARGQQILKELNKHDFYRRKTIADQWNFLTEYEDHRDLKRIIRSLK